VGVWVQVQRFIEERTGLHSTQVRRGRASRGVAATVWCFLRHPSQPPPFHPWGHTSTTRGPSQKPSIRTQPNPHPHCHPRNISLGNTLPKAPTDPPTHSTLNTQHPTANTSHTPSPTHTHAQQNSMSATPPTSRPLCAPRSCPPPAGASTWCGPCAQSCAPGVGGGSLWWVWSWWAWLSLWWVVGVVGGGFRGG